MDDTISIQSAIEALERIFNFCEEIDAHLPEDEKSGYKMFPDYMTVRKFLTQLPSAEKRGKWIAYGLEDGFAFEHYICSCCGMGIGVVTTNYCPNCGAKMERSEE